MGGRGSCFVLFKVMIVRFFCFNYKILKEVRIILW